MWSSQARSYNYDKYNTVKYIPNELNYQIYFINHLKPFKLLNYMNLKQVCIEIIYKQ